MQCITAYADDLLIQWQIRAPEQLHEAIQSSVFVLQTLEDFGMQISVEKTVVLLGLKGPQVSQLLAQYTLKHPKKGRLLKVARSPEDKSPFLFAHCCTAHIPRRPIVLPEI